MTHEMVVRNGTLVPPHEQPYVADIAVDGEQIAAIGSANSLEGEKVIDATGKHVLPGAIDAHTHHGIHNAFEQDAHTESLSALIGGVTTIGNMLIGLERPWQEIVPTYLDAVDGCYHHDHFLTLEFVPTDSAVDAVAFAIDQGVTSFKWFPTRKFEDEDNVYDDVVDAYLGALADTDVATRLGYHSENVEITRTLNERAREAGRDGFEALVEGFPSRAEAESLVSAAALAGQHGYDDSLYAVHVSARETVDELSRLQEAGYHVTGETCPHYLTLTTEECDDRMKISPPIRSAEHREALWEHVASGTIDCIGSDHCTNVTAEKTGDTIWDSVYGFPSTPVLLPLVLSEGVAEGRIDVTRAVQVTSTNPAREWGLYPRKGTLRVGTDADLVVADLDEERTVTLDLIEAANDYSPYQGRDITGWPTQTIVNGTLAVDRGEVIAEPEGTYLDRPLV